VVLGLALTAYEAFAGQEMSFRLVGKRGQLLRLRMD
jgi:hypothetical protein